MATWNDAWNALRSHIGFVEGPSNRNPWTEAMGFGNVAYCSAFATVCPHQQAGVQWPRYVQVPPVGEAYSPNWEHFPGWAYDHASRGQPCDLMPGDIVTYDWQGNGVADHTETVVQVYGDLTFDTIGANTGSPEGVHFPIRRDRKYLVGRFRSQGQIYNTAPPPPPPPPPPTPQPPKEEPVGAFALPALGPGESYTFRPPPAEHTGGIAFNNVFVSFGADFGDPALPGASVPLRVAYWDNKGNHWVVTHDGGHFDHDKWVENNPQVPPLYVPTNGDVVAFQWRGNMTKASIVHCGKLGRVVPLVEYQAG